MYYGHLFSTLHIAPVFQCAMFNVTISQWQTLKASNSETRAATANLRPDLDSSFQALLRSVFKYVLPFSILNTGANVLWA
jgi:hypothetical protein